MSPLAYCTLCWVIGLFLYPYVDLPPFGWCCGLPALAYGFHKKGFRWGFVVCVSFISLWGGYFQASLYDPHLDKKHILHSEREKPVALMIEVHDVRNPTPFGRGYVVKVMQIDNQSVRGRVLLQLEPTASLQIGERYALTTFLKPIKPPPNPGGFDFAKYMHRKGVYLTLNSHSKSLFYLNKRTTVRAWANQFRIKLMRQIPNLKLSSNSEALLKALVLGDRSGIDPEMRTTYAHAGAVHLLAISGLHIGVLMLMLQWLFGGSMRLPYPWNRWVRSTMVVICLWVYALITGLSPSVIRAVTMFSFVTLSHSIERPGMPLQSLWLSLLVLVGVRPQLIYEVGFQLSYAAVGGILWAMPKLLECYQPKNLWFSKAWRLWLLGVVAQLSVLPLSLYYFHQFPGLFWISNLAVVPFLGWILGAGIVGLCVAHISVVSTLWGRVLEWILGGMNTVIEWTAGQKEFLFTHIPFDGWDAVLSGTFVLLLFLCLQRISLSKATGVLMLSVLLHYSLKENPHPKEEWLVFHDYQQTLIGHKSGRDAIFCSPKNLLVNPRIIEEYVLDRHIKKHRHQALGVGYVMRDIPLLIVDQTGIYNLPTCKEGIVLLLNSPKIHLVDLIEILDPETIIADGSNFPSFVRRWEKTANEMGVDFHNTATEGAWIFSF